MHHSTFNYLFPFVHRETNEQRQVRLFWAKRGLINYGRECQYHSASYINALVNQVAGIKNSHFRKVRKSTFERIDTATWTLESEQDLPICKYLHLHASDNDLAKAIDDYLRLAYDSGVVFVSIFTFYFLFVCLMTPFLSYISLLF